MSHFWHFFRGLTAPRKLPALKARPTVESLEDRLTPSSPASLGTAANFAVLGLQNSQINNSNVSITGNEGVSQGGKLTNMAPSTITGDVHEYASGEYSGPGKLGGSVILDPTGMAQADSDALNAASQDAVLAPTQTFGTISTDTTVTGNGGINVIQINGDIKASLILRGTATDIFLVNVTGSVSLTGNSTLGLAGDVTAAQVIYNFTGASGSITTKVGNVLNGTLLAPNYSFNLDGTFNGEIISGKNISLLSGAKVNFVEFAPPSPTPAAPSSPSSLSGYVLDANGGAPLANVQINLLDSSGNFITSTLTNNSGFYQFTNLAAGTYGLQEVDSTLPTGYEADYATPGTVAGVPDGNEDSSDLLGEVVLNAGQNGINYDFVAINPFVGF